MRAQGAACLARLVSHHLKRPVFPVGPSLRGTGAVTATTALRPLRSTPSFRMASSSASSAVQFSEGENDLPALQDAMNGLLEQGWELDGEGRGLKKTYYFKSYFKAVSFVNVIASESAVKKHHPTMTIRIGSVDVHWTTHQPRGLSSKDINMAKHCEKGAELMSAVVKEEGKKCK